MSGARGVACPHCGAGNRVAGGACWLCRQPMGAPPAPSPVDVPVGGDGGWLVVVVLSILMVLAVGVELAIAYPGLLVIYAVLATPVLAVLARVAIVERLDFWRPKGGRSPEARSPAPARGAPAGFARGSREGPVAEGATSQLLAGVAVGLGVLGAVVGLAVLLAVAAAVIFVILCFALIAQY